MYRKIKVLWSDRAGKWLAHAMPMDIEKPTEIHTLRIAPKADIKEAIEDAIELLDWDLCRDDFAVLDGLCAIYERAEEVTE